jgi:phosphoglycolate phosphatase-like HAD superfamily hydrolase
MLHDSPHLVLQRYDYLLFDFDGVILDSMTIKTDAFRDLYQKYGDSVAMKVVQHHAQNGGMSRYKKIRFYHAEYLGIQLSEAHVDELAKQFAASVYQKVLNAQFIPGAELFLKQACANNKKCFVVSGTPQDELRQIIRERSLAHFFTEVRGAPESKEIIIKELIDTYTMERERVVMFGDAINDKLGARHNQVDFIGINYRDTEMYYDNFLPLLEKDENL